MARDKDHAQDLFLLSAQASGPSYLGKRKPTSRNMSNANGMEVASAPEKKQ